MSVAAVGSSIGASVTGLQHPAAASAQPLANTDNQAGTSSSSVVMDMNHHKKKPLPSPLAMASSAVQAAITGLGSR